MASFPRGGACVYEEFWSFNCGGLIGLWNLGHFVQTLDHRPVVVCVQEFTGEDRNLMAVKNFWSSMGYQCHDGRSSQFTSRGSPKGVVTFVLNSVSSRTMHLLEHHKGAALLVDIGSVMVVNYYVAPDLSGQRQMEQIGHLEEGLNSMVWTKPYIICGDFNEEHDGWIGTLAELRGLNLLLPVGTDSTRWDGCKVLDFFLVSSLIDGFAFVREEKLSDHKVVVLKASMNFPRQKEMKFPTRKAFSRPLWISQVRWQHLFDEAVAIGREQQWSEVCFELHHQPKWIRKTSSLGPRGTEGRTCSSNLCYRNSVSWGDIPNEDEMGEDDILGLEQDMIDYGWETFSRMFLWSLRMACYLALLEIPEEFEDDMEIRRVERLFNEAQTRGSCSLQTKAYFKNGEASSMQMRQLRKRLGRVMELKQKILRNASIVDINHLSWKVFGQCVGIEVVEQEAKKLQASLSQLETRSKSAALTNWRNRLKHKPGAKGKWLQPTVMPHAVKIQKGSGHTTTKHETLVALKEHWMNLLAEVAWSQEEREAETNSLTEFYRKHFPANLVVSRPVSGRLAEALRSVKGCPGIDGWSTSEISLLSHNQYLLSLAWREMGNWEAASLAPSSLGDVLLHFIPKPGRIGKNGHCTTKDLRPLSIFSVFWRSWSATWAKDSCISTLVDRCLPQGLTHAYKGGCGPETLASIIGHEVSRLGFGATLDFSFCFDTIDLQLLKDSLGASLPHGLRRWSNLLVGHWMTLRRWVSNCGSVLESPICLPCGIPQGDAASPLLLALYLWEGFCKVDAYLQASGAEFFQAVYMDDRTVVAARPDAVEGAVGVWADFAAQRKLIENHQKAQWISSDFPIEGYGSSMEVLGVLIGDEDPLGKRINPKQEKRIGASFSLVDRVGLLPEAKWLKLKDLAIYVQGVFAYGWVSTSPGFEQQKMLRNKFVRALGGHPYGVPTLKRLLFFVHLGLAEKGFPSASPHTCQKEQSA